MTENDSSRVDYVAPNAMFWRVLSAHRKQTAKELQDEFSKRTIVALDPGETTGVAVWFPEFEQIQLFQLNTSNVVSGYEHLETVLKHFKPDHIRAEEYRIYNWMADQHSWSVLHTPQLIGAIKILAWRLNIPLTLKLAQHAKAAWNDPVLKQCQLYNPGLKHARDACRHLLYYMAFPDSHDDKA